MTQTQLEFLTSPADEAVSNASEDGSSTFVKNMGLPIHRWFRYSAGFSAGWVADLLTVGAGKGKKHVLDPFAGSGTVLLESEACGVASVGIESHPFIARVARAKLLWRHDTKAFRRLALAVLERSKKMSPDIAAYPALIRKCYTDDCLMRLDALRRAWEAISDGSPAAELSWLALASILRRCSFVGTAQWQYILPNKRKRNAHDPWDAYETTVMTMVDDMKHRQSLPHGPDAILHQEDARRCDSVKSHWVDMVITSPPYANNYDYADATRLELCFFGQIDGWAGLQGHVRDHLIRSSTQHVSKQVGETFDILETALLAPIHDEILKVCRNLESVRDEHGGKKNYHTMIAFYFHDLAATWCALRRVCADGALLCYVIGDSAPYGVYVPVDRWLGELALAAGFKSYRFEKIRDRNVKWRNRKHRVPLQEGRLWVEG